MKHNFSTNHYMVAYIDILGQSNLILEHSIYPPSDIDRERINKALSETSEYILYLREIFKNHFSNFRRLKDALSGLTENQKKEVQRLGTFSTLVNGMSDSFIITVPLESKTEYYVPINNIFGTLQGICLVYGIAMANGKPVRGGIDVGWGTHLNDSEVYGSALVKAYKLETEKAKYPRILIGESLWNFINHVENQKPKTLAGKRARVIAGKCKRLIIKDGNKNYMLDVLNNEDVKKSNIGLSSEIVDKGYRFIITYQRKCKKKNDIKLFERYSLLRNYYENKLSAWGLTKA
jgi:hypothetical protein